MMYRKTDRLIERNWLDEEDGIVDPGGEFGCA